MGLPNKFVKGLVRILVFYFYFLFSIKFSNDTTSMFSYASFSQGSKESGAGLNGEAGLYRPFKGGECNVRQTCI